MLRRGLASPQDGRRDHHEVEYRLLLCWRCLDVRQARGDSISNLLSEPQNRVPFAERAVPYGDESVLLLRTSMDGWCHLSESPSILSPLAYSLLLPLAGRLVLQVQAAQLMQRRLPALLVIASIGL